MSQEERGHDGLTSKERIAQMTQPITEDWYSHQIAIVNKRNAKLEADNKALLDALKTCRSFLATHPEYQRGLDGRGKRDGQSRRRHLTGRAPMTCMQQSSFERKSLPLDDPARKEYRPPSENAGIRPRGTAPDTEHA